MKNFKHYLFGALTMSAALAFTACTSENEVGEPQENVKGFYLQMSLIGETPTRTELEQPQLDATVAESNVTTGTLFLFQGPALKFQKKITANDWMGDNPSQGVTGTTNVIAVSVSNVDPNTEYSVYFLANDNQAGLDVAGNPLGFIYNAERKFAGTMADADAFVMFNQNDPSCKADQYKVEFTEANKSVDNPAKIKGSHEKTCGLCVDFCQSEQEKLSIYDATQQSPELFHFCIKGFSRCICRPIDKVVKDFILSVIHSCRYIIEGFIPKFSYFAIP